MKLIRFFTIYVRLTLVPAAFFFFPSYVASQEAAVGSISGMLSATPSGGATYTIPIDCPQGVGLQPEISLIYNSQSGNGIAGWGWSIGGTSAIMRTHKIRHFESSNSVISWKKGDPLTLNGQRLIIERSWTDSIEYRLENDPSVMVRAYQFTDWGPSYLKAYMKNGLIMTYGDPALPASYIRPLSETMLPLDNPTVLGWQLVEVTDPNGNYMQIDNSGVVRSGLGSTYFFCESSISRITYGGNKRTGNTDLITVTFEYDIRPDALTNYIAGKEFLHRKRLKAIKTAVGNEVQKEYRLSYNFSSAVSYLESIGLYDREGRKLLEPLTFNYGSRNSETGDTSIPTVYNYGNGTKKRNSKLVAVDLDGDGICEFGDIYNEQGNSDLGTTDFSRFDVRRKSDRWEKSRTFDLGYSSFYEKGENYNVFADLDCDGTAERVVLSLNTMGEIKLKVIDCVNSSTISDITLFNHQQISELNIPFLCVGNAMGHAYGTLMVILDMPEEIGLSRPHYRYSYQLLSGSREGRVILSPATIYNFVVPSKLVGASFVKTENFNCRDDVWLFLEDGSVRIISNTQNHEGLFGASRLEVLPFKIHKDTPYAFGDLNGDGLTDVIFRENTNQWKIAYNKGNYLFNVVDLGTMENKCNLSTGLNTPTVMMVEEKDEVFLIDINQDGLTDIVFADERLKEKLPRNPSYYAYEFKETAWSFFLNTGNGEFENHLTQYSSERASYACFGDMMGKGDINWVHADALGNMKIKTFAFPRYPNLLTKVVNPVSGETTLEYKPHIECTLTGYDRYSLDNYLSMLSMPFNSSLYKVFSGSDDGITKLAYRYGKPIINWEYRGLMGFRFFEELDVRKNLWEVTEFTFPEQGKPYYLMLPYSKQMYGKKGNSNVITNTEQYGYAVKSYRDFSNNATKRYSVHIDSLIQTGYLAGGTTVRNYYRYDDRNNLLESLTKGYGQTERNLYGYKKNAAWCDNKMVRQVNTVTCLADGTAITKISSCKYDGRGNLTEMKVDSGNTMGHTLYYKNYNPFGNPLVTEQSASGATRRSTVSYLPSGRFVSSKTDHLGQTTSYSWNTQKGLLRSSTDRMGTTSYAYDRFNRIESITHPTGVVETQEIHWIDGDPAYRYYTVKTHPGMRGKTRWTYYDKFGRVAAEETYGADASGRKVRVNTLYYPDGRLYRVSKPFFVGSAMNWGATYYYDSFGRVQVKDTPRGSTTVQYSASEDSMTVRTPDKIATTTVWNSHGQETSSIKAGKAVNYVYTLGNQLKTATPEGGLPVTFSYDRNGNRTGLVDPSTSRISSFYGAWGQLIREFQVVGTHSVSYAETNYTYFSNGLLSQKRRSYSGVTTETNYDYDTQNRLTRVFNNDSERAYTYDNFDRITHTLTGIRSKALITEKVYDEYGRVIQHIYPSGYYVINYYDSYGNLSAVTDRNSNLVWSLRECDAEGHVLSESKGGPQTTYTYNEKGDLTSIYSLNVVDMRYTYDEQTGNLKRFQDAKHNKAEKYTYDSMDRLTSWTVENTTASPAYISYDSKGRVDTKNEYLGYSWYTYGSAERPYAPTQVYHANAVPQESVTYTAFKKVETLESDFFTYKFSYGPEDELLYMEGGLTGAPYGKKTRYYAENYEENETLNYYGNYHYIYGGNGLAGIYTSNNNMLFNVHTDRLGSIVAVGSGYSVYEYYAYDPWGNRRNTGNWTAQSSPPGICYRGYTGHEHLDDLGLINMNARLYDPKTSQFLSPDPQLQDPTNWLNYNRYTYCLNNPLKYTDPNGEFWWFVAGGALIGAYVGASIKGGSFNPGKWENKWWQGAIYGAIIGGTAGRVMGGMWESGATINFGVSIYGSKPIELLSFSPATAKMGGAVTMTVGAGLGLGSTLTYTIAGKPQKDITPFDVGMEWLTGYGPREREFGEGDYFTELVKQHGHLDVTRDMLRENFKNGIIEDGINNYSLSGLKGAVLYAKDYATIVTGGSDANLAVPYLGSFDLNYKVLSSEGNSALVQFEVTNSSTAGSAFRPPVIGYTSQWKDYVVPWVNNAFREGPLSKTKQKFKWKERINF